VCLDCEIGKYQPLDIATTNACSVCAAGQFAASGSVAACSICTEGQFQDLNAAVEYKCTCYIIINYELLLVVGSLMYSLLSLLFFPRQSVYSGKLSRINE
jgi:hypothetical protein